MIDIVFRRKLDKSTYNLLQVNLCPVLAFYSSKKLTSHDFYKVGLSNKQNKQIGVLQ